MRTSRSNPPRKSRAARLERPKRPARPAADLLARGLYWAPVWLPALLVLQLTTRGLWPAWRESGRLDQESAAMDARSDGLKTERARLERDLEKLDDPIYRERVRRSSLAAGFPVLTLAVPFVGPEADAPPAPHAARPSDR